jgi:hypothetical protein
MTITQQKVGAGSASSLPIRLGRPSYTPTILVTIFFGVFGLIPAFRHSRMARERGYSSAGYWWAFWLPILIPMLLLLSISMSAFAFMPHGHSFVTVPGSNPAGSSSVEQAPVWQPAPVGDMPYESSNDSPQAVLQYMDGPGGVLDKAYATGNETYLLNYYASSNMSAFRSDLKAILGFRRHHGVTVSNIQVNSQGFKTFTASFEAKLGDAKAAQLTSTYIWSSRTNASEKTGEWTVTSVTSP